MTDSNTNTATGKKAKSAYAPFHAGVPADPLGAGAAAADHLETNPPGRAQQMSQQQISLAHVNSQQQQAPDEDTQEPDLPAAIGQIQITDTVAARLGATGVIMVQTILSLASTMTEQLRSSLSQDIILTEHATQARDNFLPFPKFGTCSHPDPKSIKSLLQQMGSVQITCLCQPKARTIVFRIFKCAKEIIEDAGLNERAGLLLLQPCFGGRFSLLLSHCLRKREYCAFQAYMQDAAC